MSQKPYSVVPTSTISNRYVPGPALLAARPVDAPELSRVLIVDFRDEVFAGTECKYRSLDDGDIYAQISLIEEEWNELLTAYEADDRKEVADAACDIIVVATGLLHKLGYNPVKAMSIVNNSNMSKFVDPDNKEDVEASIRKYDEDDRYTDVYVDERGVVWGTVVATGSKKILKGIHYKEPQWHELDPELK